MKKFKSAKFWLIISLVLCLISSIVASSAQSSFGQVRVEDIQVLVDDGYLINAQAYIPKKASADNKLPLIILSHGSFNNYDHQDLNMIELSRRGFVVISSDAYRHGSSEIYTNKEDNYMGMVHMMEYATNSYSFIDQEKIGVSGHSMGGIISNLTVQHYFQQEALGLGEQKISAILLQGFDPVYAPYTFEGVDEPVMPAINWGVAAGKYDEWMFKAETGNPALYLESENAKAFINQLEGVNLTGPVESDKIYRGTINGEEFIRVIYQNTEIHPWNHFSYNTNKDLVNFFYETLGVPAGYEKIDATNQIWQIKEGFNFVGLIGILIFIFSFAAVLMDEMPYFGALKAAKPVPCAPALDTPKKKAAYWVTYVINLAIPGLLVIPVMFKWIGKGASSPGTFNNWFCEPNTNELAVWTIIVAISIFLVYLISRKLSGNTEKGVPEYWGLKASLSEIVKSFFLAFITVSMAYVILFASDLIFNVDYRIWVIDMRVFNVEKIPAAIAYFPAFALFYLINSLLVNGANRVEGMPDWLVTVISCISNVGGMLVLIFLQYHSIIVDGITKYNPMRVVNLFPLLFLIPVGTIIGRLFFKKTGKIYVGSFAVAMLYTMMTVANTLIKATILG